MSSPNSDHNSQIKFVEKWLAAKGKNVDTPEMVPWRRTLSYLVNAFDFDNPDYSVTNLPDAPVPHIPHKDAKVSYHKTKCSLRQSNLSQ